MCVDAVPVFKSLFFLDYNSTNDYEHAHASLFRFLETQPLREPCQGFALFGALLGTA